jgi:hypothetical protein
MKPVMNLDEVYFGDVEENGLYTSSRAQISDHIGARKLGYNLTVLPPGKARCPAISRSLTVATDRQSYHSIFAAG